MNKYDKLVLRLKFLKFYMFLETYSNFNENEIIVFLITFIVALFYIRIRKNLKNRGKIFFFDISLIFFVLARFFSILEAYLFPIFLNLIEHIFLLLFIGFFTLFFLSLHIQEESH
jgi:hypothetical protein